MYEARHKRQSVGIEGANLVEQRRWEILASAGSISWDSILQFDDTQFHIASASCPGDYYTIDLTQQHCNCKDFHQIEFCKHLVAVWAHFPHLCSEGNTKVTVPAQEPHKNLNPEHSRPAHNLGTLPQEVSVLSRTLAAQPITKLDSSPAIVEAFRTLKHSLMAAFASRQGTSTLPNKEKIPPNQKTWQETVQQMGVQHTRAWKQLLPADLAKEHGINDCCIGATNVRKRKNEDPYLGGDRSGKRSQPDALSPEANDHARTSQAGTAAPTFPTFLHSPAQTPTHVLVPPATQPMPHGVAYYMFPPPPPPHFPFLILVYVGVRENTQLFRIHTMYCSLIARTDRSAYLHICVCNV